MSAVFSGFLTVVFYCLLLGSVCSSRVSAQEPHDPESSDSSEHQTTTTEATQAESDEGSPESQDKATDERAGAALRNENVFASKMDTDTAIADNRRLGGSYSIISTQPIEVRYYAAEYGKNPTESILLGRANNIRDAWHGEIFESLQNSVFNARTFFQVGSVKPSRMNQYGVRFSGRLPGWGFVSGNFGQEKNRGMVNGNALVPLSTERNPAPDVTDPATRAFIYRILGAYPLEEPNRTDIDPRALNTNAPQSIDATNATLRLDGQAGRHGILSMSHSLNRQSISAFQFVAGQNPDTIIHSQTSRLTYRWILSDATEYSFAGGFFRVRSDLHPDPTAVGPRVRFNNAIEGLGPAGQYPLNRAENTFKYGFTGNHRFNGGRHHITFGANISRYHLNGMEQNGIRGEFQVSNNFGRGAIENLLEGTPTTYTVRIGNHYRGFRSWLSEAFIGDQWNVTPNLQLNYGVHHSLMTKPVEVNNLDQLPFPNDWNNFGPRFAFAYRGPKDWIARASYSLTFGDIFPVTYSQIRYNPPGVLAITVSNPSFVDPLAGVDITSGNPRTSLTRFSPNLSVPYSHQYNFLLEHAFGPLTLEVGYLGSRTFKLMTPFIMNRAVDVPGIPLTTKTINDRRPDPRYYEINDIVNAGIAYLDAAQVATRIRPLKGFTGGATFTWGKALDTGNMYTSTAANNDLFNRSQYQYEYLRDQKALSQLDSTYSLAVFGARQLPSFSRAWRPVHGAFANWQVSGVVMAKSGTPFTVTTGGDAPGFGNVDGVGSDRPHILNPSILGATVGNPATSQQILNPAFFAFITPGEVQGNLGRNTFRKGAIFNANASISREWKWGAQRTYLLRFQGDAYNLTNHPQFDEPQNQTSSPSFGKITNTLNNGRVLQFGLRLIL